MSHQANLVIDFGRMGERNVRIKYDYQKGCTDMVPHGNQAVALNTKPTVYVHSALITIGGNTTDIIDFITDDDLTRLHNDIIEENHL